MHNKLLLIKVGRYAWIPLERISQLCHQGVEFEEYYVIVLFYIKNEGDIISLSKPFVHYAIWGQTLPRVLPARGQKTQEKSKGNNTTTHAHQSQVSLGPSKLLKLQVNQGLHKWALDQDIQRGYKISGNSNLHAHRPQPRGRYFYFYVFFYLVTLFWFVVPKTETTFQEVISCLVIRHFCLLKYVNICFFLSPHPSAI